MRAVHYFLTLLALAGLGLAISQSLENTDLKDYLKSGTQLDDRDEYLGGLGNNNGAKNVINLAQMSLTPPAPKPEPKKSPKEVVKTEKPLKQSEIDTKPSRPKNFDPNNIQLDKVCNILLEGGVCLASNDNEENKYSYQKDLIAFFDFNQEINVDLSGSKTVINKRLKAGPGVDEKGASAFFNGDNYVTVDHNDKWNSKEMRISFWIYIIETTHSKDKIFYCPIVLKGFDDYKKQKYNRYPGIFIQENSRKVRAFVSLADQDKYRDVTCILLRESGLNQ